MRFSRWTAAALLSAMAMGWLWHRGSSDTLADSEAPAAPMLASGEADSLAPPPATRPDAWPALQLAPQVQHASKAERIAALLATAAPAAFFEAYEIIAACVRVQAVAQQRGAAVLPETRHWMEQVPTPDTACGDISPGQIASRAQYLEVAAKAGIRGAAMAYLHEGPLGDPALNASANVAEAHVAEWMRRSRAYVRQAADQGEIEAIANMSNYYQFTEINQPMALKYFAAQLELMSAAQKQAQAVSIQQAIDMLQSGLSEGGALEAVAAGRALVTAAGATAAASSTRSGR